MSPKEQLYLATSDALAPLWQQDAAMLEQDPERWQLVREIEDWLIHYGGWTILLQEEPFDILYQDHDRVSVVQYKRICDRLQALYGEQGEEEEQA